MDSVAVVAECSALQDRLKLLARELCLPLVGVNDQNHTFHLTIRSGRLELRERGPNAPGPVYVDFTAGALAYRRRFGGGRNQPLARAVGLKSNASPSVLDVTAGLGRDAFVLACLGCRVHLVERSPIVAALLHDGIERALGDPDIGALVHERMRLSVTDAQTIMRSLSSAERPDIVYLDPMYPTRWKSALVKKEMRLLRSIVGDDDDAPALLATALICARRRVVVKRPHTAVSLTGPRPAMHIAAKNTRFDIYPVAAFNT